MIDTLDKTDVLERKKEKDTMKKVSIFSSALVACLVSAGANAEDFQHKVDLTQVQHIKDVHG
jgi:hypothetical protein